VVAGGDSEATGTAGLGSGNIGQAPVALPAQLFGNGASVLGGGDQNASGTTSMTAGGDAYSDGQDGALSGNVVSSPLASAGQAFGESAAVLGHNESNASSSTTSTAGGDVQTDGTDGFGTGNVVSPQALANAQSFAAAASALGGINSADADSTSALTSGGDINTAGDDGFLAGNLLDVPAAGVAQPFGDAVAALGSHSEASGNNTSSNSSGGTSTTSGTPGSLSGMDGTVPVGANAPVYDVPVEVLAEAITNSYNASEVFVGEDAGQLNIPISGGGMAPTELPMIMGGSAQRSLPGDHVPFAGSFSGVLDGFAGAGRSDLPVSGDLPVLNDLTDLTAVLPVVPAVPAAPGLPALPAVPAVGDLADVSPNLPTAPAVPQANPTAMVPAVGGADLTEIVPNVPSAADVPVVQTPTLGNLPVGGARSAPAMPGLDSASALDDASLSATRAALNNLFAIHPMA
jgi:trimeric autotransporter adhesin